MKQMGGSTYMETAPGSISGADKSKISFLNINGGSQMDQALLVEMLAEIKEFKNQQGERPVVIDDGEFVEVKTKNHTKIIRKRGK